MENLLALIRMEYCERHKYADFSRKYITGLIVAYRILKMEAKNV